MAEYSAGFSISVYNQDLIEENAKDHYSTQYGGDPEDRAKALRKGFINEKAEITRKGFDQLNTDIQRLELNSMKWMRNTFDSARDEGHDSFGDLIGTFWFDPKKVKQAWLVTLASPSPGAQERIDMEDSSYGDLSKTVFQGVSDFGQAVLGGHIAFFNVPKDAWGILENTLERARRRSSR